MIRAGLVARRTVTVSGPAGGMDSRIGAVRCGGVDEVDQELVMIAGDAHADVGGARDLDQGQGKQLTHQRVQEPAGRCAWSLRSGSPTMPGAG